MDHEIRVLLASVRDQQQQQRRLLREISAIAFWQHVRDRPKLAQWVAAIALEGRRRELEALEEDLVRAQSRLSELIARQTSSYSPSNGESRALAEEPGTPHPVPS